MGHLYHGYVANNQRFTSRRHCPLLESSNARKVGPGEASWRCRFDWCLSDPAPKIVSAGCGAKRGTYWYPTLEDRCSHSHVFHFGKERFLMVFVSRGWPCRISTVHQQLWGPRKFTSTCRAWKKFHMLQSLAKGHARYRKYPDDHIEIADIAGN